MPLIFGKWALLRRTRDYAYEWFLPILYQNIEDEFARSSRPGPVTVTLGGVKEYQETMQEMAFHTTVRLFELYRGLSSTLSHGDQNENAEISLIGKRAGLLALEQKQKELVAFVEICRSWHVY